MLEKIRKIRNWCFLLLLALGSLHWSVRAAQNTLLQRGIAEKTLRFHVLANSDSEEDQRVKLQVRDAVLAYLEEAEQKRNPAAGREAQRQFLLAHLEGMEAAANCILDAQKMNYRAVASLERCYFPDRTCGAVTYPAGWYEALRIRLGSAGGHNWWCVLYPRISFSDCLHAVGREGQLQELEETLTEAEYEELLREPKRWKIGFRWLR